MAAFSMAEFTRAVDLLSSAIGFEQLKDRLVRLRAFSSKRGLGSVSALAERLYTLSGGLRREGSASYGFQHAWADVFLSRVGEEDEHALGEIADRINACLTERHAVDPEKMATLDRELALYHGLLARSLGDEVAQLDMMMKAVPGVAERIREWPGTAPQPPGDAPSSPEQAESSE